MTDALTNEDRTALLSDVTEQIDEMASLVGDLTELARSGPGATDERLDVSFDVIVGSALKRAQRRAPGMVWNVELRQAMVSANPQLLERAVMNLCDNAAKWSPSGGTITVQMDDAAKIAGGVRLVVSDEGPGIAPEIRTAVLNAFGGPQTRELSMPGSGLGLSIVAQVDLDRHGRHRRRHRSTVRRRPSGDRATGRRLTDPSNVRAPNQQYLRGTTSIRYTAQRSLITRIAERRKKRKYARHRQVLQRRKGLRVDLP